MKKIMINSQKKKEIQKVIKSKRRKIKKITIRRKEPRSKNNLYKNIKIEIRKN